MFAQPISMPRFKSIMFLIKIALKLSYSCKKMQNFRALEAAGPLPLRISGYVPREQELLRPSQILCFLG